MKKLIFLGLISFLLAAIWFMPLAFVVPHIAKVSSDVVIQEPSGTLWDGEVNHLTVKNNYLGKATWQVDPLQSIKSLSLKTKFTLKGDDINANGLAGITIDKDLVINNTQFDVNARYINTLQSNAKLSGNFNGFVKHAVIKRGKVPAIDAIVNWQNGALDSPIKLAAGDYRAVIKPENDDLDIKLSSKEAPIELNGDIKLQKDWVFATNLITKSSNPGLMAMMKFAGKPQTDGTILIKQTGDLKPFIGIN